MKIIHAKLSDCKELSELTYSSKKYWGYSDEQLNYWIDDLTITEAYLKWNTVMKIEDKNKIIAYYSLGKIAGRSIKLDNLFVRPDHIRQGLGTILLNDAINESLNLNCKIIWLESDPNAASFYLKHGFNTIAQKKSSIPDRFIPVMNKEIK
jgi:N-acetylglutamate synthase-like GNAT family acetyltransferase